MQFEEFSGFLKQTNTRQQANDATSGPAVEDESKRRMRPHSLIAKSKQRWLTICLSVFAKAARLFRLMVNLLPSMGYGCSTLEAAHLGRSGDDGVDA
jgi:restriction endonuclease Mrr